MNIRALSIFFLLFIIFGSSISVSGQTRKIFKGTNWLPDSDGDRYFLPSGFVVNMEEEVLYNIADFRRISRYGANCIVIRIGIGNLGAWPGYEPNQNYLEKLDSYVEYAGNAGLKIIFKMTVYDLRGEVNDVWKGLLETDSAEQEELLNAWKILWKKYANNNSVVGYDLINEPMPPEESKKDVVGITNTQLVPLYHKLISGLRSISKDKWAIYQPLLRRVKTGDTINLPFVRLEVPVNDEKLIYAPHAYYDDLEKLEDAVEHHLKEAKISGAKLMMGEWGRHTPSSADTSLQQQLDYFKLYANSAKIYDENNIGGIKAWFRGTPAFLHHNGRTFTWSIFRDTTGVGTTERKYIVDVISRPKPLYMTGKVENFGFDFTTRTFSMKFNSGSLDGNSEIYIPERHYPDGFTVEINNIRLVRDSQSEDGLTVVNGDPELVPSSFSYDEKNERLVFTTWDNQSEQNKLKIKPGIFN